MIERNLATYEIRQIDGENVSRSSLPERSRFNFHSIESLIRICDTSDRKFGEVEKRVKVTLSEVLARPFFRASKWDNEPQNSENIVSFQEITDFERNPSISLQISKIFLK